MVGRRLPRPRQLAGACGWSSLRFLLFFRFVFRRRVVERALEARGEVILVKVFGAPAWVDNLGHGREGLVLLSQEDGEDALGLRRVGRVRRAVPKLVVVVIDFPEHGLAVELEAPEVVLAVGVVLARERIEGADSGKRPVDEVVTVRGDAARHHELACPIYSMQAERFDGVDGSADP
jgi:hypothetical protein